MPNVMFSQRGVLNLGHTPAQLDDFARRGNAMRHLGADSTLLSREDLAKRVPALDLTASASIVVPGFLDSTLYASMAR